MWRLISVALAVTWLTILVHQASFAGEGAKTLQGVWTGQSMEADGKPAPAEAAKRMRFTFKGDKLFIRGNFADDAEMECTYKVDLKQVPNHLEFTPLNTQKTSLGIFEVKGDELKVCLRHARSDEGRPTSFATQAGSRLVLIVLRKQKS